MKPLTNFLLAVAALVTALTALIRATEEPAAQATYTELRKAVAQLSHDVRATHDDVEVLWSRVEGSDAVCAPEPSATPSFLFTPALAPTAAGVRKPPPKPAFVDPPSFERLKAAAKF